MRSIEPSGPGAQGQGVRQAPVHCESSALLDHPDLKVSARRHKIPCRSCVLSHLCYYAELCLCLSHIVPAFGEVSRLWLDSLQELMVRTVSCFKYI